MLVMYSAVHQIIIFLIVLKSHYPIVPIAMADYKVRQSTLFMSGRSKGRGRGSAHIANRGLPGSASANGKLCNLEEVPQKNNPMIAMPKAM